MPSSHSIPTHDWVCRCWRPRCSERRFYIRGGPETPSATLPHLFTPRPLAGFNPVTVLKTRPVNIKARGGRELGVVLSKNYMNFSIRLGYHLSTVEAYVSDQVNDNYLTFGFRGGGSTPERRERRARLIEAIIDHLHLNHRRKGELIEARLAKYPAEQMAQRLTLLGKLTHYTKQLDMVLFSDSIVEWYIKDFVQEHVGK